VSENESELEPLLTEADQFQMDVVNKYAGLAGTPAALVPMDDEHAIAWLERIPPESDGV
jgi:hypothetical protein